MAAILSSRHGSVSGAPLLSHDGGSGPSDLGVRRLIAPTGIDTPDLAAWPQLVSPPAHRHHVVHPHCLLHHERLAILHADQVAVEARDGAQPLANLLLLRKQFRAFAVAPYCER